MSDSNHDNSIAIIGMAGRFPGARNITEFWENLRAGKESIRRFTDEELAPYEYDFAAIKDNASYVRARGVLDDVEMFDAKFFGMMPREAAVLDPQHRVWLECAWQALEVAGCAPDKFDGSIGVFAGGYITSYLLHNLCVDRDYIEKLVRFRAVDAFQNIVSNDKDYLPTRTAYKFNLKGPAVNVQTACSTSLVAVCQACQSLLHYESDVCLAGGVCITFPQVKGYLCQEGAMLSPDGHCRAFDADAGGTIFSNGVGVVVLKRLADAIQDGDPIEAVILGSALNNDGAVKVSYTAPSIDGQAEVVAMAQAVAEVDPETITYIEAHGTGTPLGDPIEIAGLTKAFRAKTQAKQFCGIGSVKTNVGHLDSASGITGLIKAVLAVRHGELPPSLHFKSPNPDIDFAQSPFYVVTELQDWKPAGGVPRRAGVSSFGVGGTNAHVVLEQPPQQEATPHQRPWVLLPLSAKTETALAQAVQNLDAHLKAEPDQSLADVAHTLQSGRQDFSHRWFVVGRDHDEIRRAIEENDRRHVATQRCGDLEPSLVFMFPGQGAQHVQMGRELYEQEPVFRQVVDDCSEILQPLLDVDLRTLLYPKDGADEDSCNYQLRQTKVTQPALYVIEYALARLWQSWGISPQAMIGHSVGEYVAAAMAGVFSMEDGLKVLAERARLMQEQPAGSMLAVRLSEDELKPHLRDDLTVAALNGPALTVASGPTESIDQLRKQLKKQAIGAKALHTSHAFHSAMMDPVVEPFAKTVATVQRSAPQIPFISSLTGTWITDAEATDPQYWAQQIRQGVRFSPGIRELQRQPGRVLLEVGPSRTLSTLAMQHPNKEAAQTVVASLGHAQERTPDLLAMLHAAGRLWGQGVAPDWSRLYDGERRRRVVLPTYPFERQRHWIEPPAPSAAGAATTGLAAAPAVATSAAAAVPAAAVAAAPTQPAPSPADARPRKERLVDKLREQLYDLSGIDLSEEDPDTSFLELGLDSLFLTQASAALQNEFGVKVSFRQLLEDVDSIRLLAEYLDEQLPADQFQPEVAAAPAAPEGAAPGVVPAVPTSGVPAPTGAPLNTVEGLIQAQLNLMNEQLAMLSGTGAPMAGAAMPAPPTPPTITDADFERPDAADTSAAKKVAANRFGPYKKIERGSGGGLTDEQQEHLNGLIERLSKKTAKSKQLAETYRTTLADPRSVAGFRTLWKELVYQTVCARSLGSKIWDVDGNEYVDITMCFGANILGHNPPFIREAVEQQLQLGVEIGPQSPLAGEVAEQIREFTRQRRVTFCNTGSEAVMATLRMARTVTGRTRFAFFSGDYHGTFDEVLAREQVLRGKIHTKPAAPGIPECNVQHNLVLDYGTPESFAILERYADQLAAVLVEPIQSRHPDVQPQEFLSQVRELTRRTGTALIFDEVITGFRVAPGGAQEWFGVEADLASYGKIIGGGMPIGAVAGNPQYMDALDGGEWHFGDDSIPEADVTFFAGTFVRHPLALAAAKATLTHLKEQGSELQQQLTKRTSAFAEELNDFFVSRSVPIRILHFSSWYRFDYPYDLTYAQLLFYHLLDKGIYIREAGQNCFFSTAHTTEDIQKIIRAIKQSVLELQSAGFLPAADEGGDDAGTRPGSSRSEYA